MPESASCAGPNTKPVFIAFAHIVAVICFGQSPAQRANSAVVPHVFDLVAETDVAYPLVARGHDEAIKCLCVDTPHIKTTFHERPFLNGGQTSWATTLSR